MPYLTREGVRIHYHVEGEGPPLVLQHGTLQSMQDWHSYGYARELRENYRLILVDSRGHGKSEKPHDPDLYELCYFAGDIVAVLDRLGIAKANYFGYSMGGWIGFGLAKFAPDRFHSFIIGASHPYERSFASVRTLLGQDYSAYLASIESGMAEPIESEVKARLWSNDVPAMVSACRDRPDMEGLLQTIEAPCLVYAGESDPVCQDVERAANQLHRGTFFSMPGLGHYQGFTRSDLVLPYVKEFLAKVNPR